MKISVLCLTLIAAAPLTAGVQYYLTDKLTSIDPAKWTVVGGPAASLAGLANASSNAGSLISKVKIPDGSNEAEIDATLTLIASGGVYTEMVQATPDAHTANQGSGSYLAFEMQNPKFDSTGHCMANFVLLQSVAGTVSLLSSFQHACRNGMVMRLAVNGSLAFVWPDQPNPIEFPIVPASGQPGIGSYSTPPGNSISQVQLGSIGRNPPPPVNKGAIGVSTFRNHTDVQWKPVTGDPNGPPLAGYFVYRDGLYLLRTTATHFSDEAVSPGAQHIYTIYAVDEHYNQSPGMSVSATTPVPHK